MERKEVLSFFEDANSDWKQNAEKSIRQCRMGRAEIKVVDECGKAIPHAEIKVTQSTHEFKFGANCFMLDELESEEKNRIYKDKFARLFNMATIPFYWRDTEPQKGQTRYSVNSKKVYRRPPVDLCLKYCDEHGIEPREHALAYDAFYPSWLKGLSEDSVKKEMEHHFEEIATLYKDKIKTIEVTNELFWEEGTVSFYKSPEFFEWCFEKARQYFPNNKLVCNDWTGLSWQADGDMYYNQVCEKIKKGASVDAIGLQYHMHFSKEDEPERARKYYNPKYLSEVINSYAKLNKSVQITEITVPAYSDSAEDEEIQALLAEYLYTLWFSCPSVEQIIYWNLVDGYAHVWDAEKIAESQGDMSLGENVYYGGLLRFDMSEKPVYAKLDELINKRWHTEDKLTANENGYAFFDGFYGSYDVCITAGGKEYKQKILLSSQEKNEFTVTVK